MAGLFSYPKRRIKKMIKDGDYQEALELGKRLEQKNPKDADLFFIIGSIYYILGDAKNAINYFEKSLAIDDTDIETLLLKANVHLYLKEKEQAIECCNKVFKIDPKNREADEILNKLANL
jgi:tetratricopeptide (TPR) repeat protein